MLAPDTILLGNNSASRPGSPQNTCTGRLRLRNRKCIVDACRVPEEEWPSRVYCVPRVLFSEKAPAVHCSFSYSFCIPPLARRVDVESRRRGGLASGRGCREFVSDSTRRRQELGKTKLLALTPLTSIISAAASTKGRHLWVSTLVTRRSTTAHQLHRMRTFSLFFTGGVVAEGDKRLPSPLNMGASLADWLYSYGLPRPYGRRSWLDRFPFPCICTVPCKRGPLQAWDLRGKHVAGFRRPF